MTEGRAGEILLRPQERIHFEYAVLVSVVNSGGPLDLQQVQLERYREELLDRMVDRVNAYFDSIVLMER